jgi:hypothetical protein
MLLLHTAGISFAGCIQHSGAPFTDSDNGLMLLLLLLLLQGGKTIKGIIAASGAADIVINNSGSIQVRVLTANRKPPCARASSHDVSLAGVSCYCCAAAALACSIYCRPFCLTMTPSVTSHHLLGILD